MQRADGEGPFRYANFRLLFGARTTSSLGTAIAPVGLAFAVLASTGSTADLGIVLAARMLPFVLFTLIGGVLADRLPRQLLMIGSDAVSAVAQLATGVVVLSGSHSLVTLVVLQLVSGSANAFFMPAVTGLLPHTVPAAVFPQASAAMSMSRNLSLMLGGAAGGFIAAVSSPGWTLVVDGITFAVSGLLSLGLKVTWDPPPAASLLRDLRGGWDEFRSRIWLWAIVAQFSIFVGFGVSAQLVLGPVVAREHLGGAAAWGWVLSLEGVGSVVAATVLVRWRHDFARPLLVASIGVLADAGPSFGLLRPVPLAWLLALSFLAGVGSQVFAVMWETTMAREVPPQTLSRVSAYDLMGSYVLAPLGLAITGPLVAATGVQGGLWIGIAATVLPTVAVMLVPDIYRRRGVSG